MGCAMPEGEQGMNVGRNIALLAGLPDTVPGMTVNRFCSLGAGDRSPCGAMQIMTGQRDVVIAGGIETMTMVPMGGLRYLPNPTLAAENPEALLGMGLTAERLVERDGITREAQDEFAYAQPPARPWPPSRPARFVDEIVPVMAHLPGTDAKGRPADVPSGVQGGRGPARRHHGRGPGQAEARLQAGRHRDRRQQQPDERRRRGRAAGLAPRWPRS